MGNGTGDFAEALRGLKERSGLSYGALAKRAHMSASTLHRYCNGDAVPTEFAPVERLARLCGASRDELVALHRRWIVADDARGRGRVPAVPAEAEPVAEEAEPSAVEPSVEEVEPSVVDAEPSVVGGAAGEAPVVGGAPVAVRRRRFRFVAAAAAVVVLTASAALAVALDGGAPRPADGAAAPSGRAGGTVTVPSGAGASAPTGGATPGPSAAPSRSGAAGAPSVAPSRGSSGAPAPAPGQAGPGRGGGPVPLSVDVRPYVWSDPCSQVYVIDRPPERVPPPPPEQDARGWVKALGGVPGGDMLLEVAVQGTGDETVVLRALHVRVVGKDAPLPWNAYGMGVGCGGSVTPQSLDVDLDAARPRAVPVAGQQGDREIPAVDLPYTVTASDPEVLRVTAHTAGHSVRWYLELEWSSGGRSGTLRVDDRGEPFATSAIEGRPVFDQPLGSSGWGPRVSGDG
ncbi:helix-turn-helix domain-containing protein [Streptomyces sp. NPDC015131]|uniref:helix-turn-helix domain-containing protein n=1 Tax=Streptomyces sp. NPDC015131 TaxID=3364941 RepID=UPI0036FE66AC